MKRAMVLLFSAIVVFALISAGGCNQKDTKGAEKNTVSVPEETNGLDMNEPAPVPEDTPPY